MAELLEEHEADCKQKRVVVTKRIQGLTVMLGEQRAAFFGDGELRFTSWARECCCDGKLRFTSWARECYGDDELVAFSSH